MADRAGRKRLFFALWPDEDTRRRIHRLARDLPRRKGRLVARDNLHVTLVFLGMVEAEREACIVSQAEQVPVEPFELELGEVGYFPRPRVMWLGPRECPPQLEVLVRRLNEVLGPCGHHPEARPFHPHLTLLRDARPVEGAAREFRPIVWRVEGFSLIESRTLPEGVRYEPLRRYR